MRCAPVVRVARAATALAVALVVGACSGGPLEPHGEPATGKAKFAATPARGDTSATTVSPDRASQAVALGPTWPWY
jgi:hypothetical protein